LRFERLGTLLLCVLLVGVGAFAWWLQLRPALGVDASALAALPAQIGDFSSRDVPLEAAEEAELRADLNLQRLYLDPNGDAVWLYIGYYGTARGGRPEHTPRGCYTGAGWGIASTRVLDADPATGLRVNEYVVERDGEHQLVLFWYRSHRKTGLLGGLDQNLDRLLGRLSQGRADGALIRLSTAIEAGDEAAARSRLLALAARLDPLLAARWPEERPTPAVAAP
jgi:EpsI family protein